MRNFLKIWAREISRNIIAMIAIIGIAAFAFAFTEPSVGPTGGTVYAPVNTSGTAQLKSGDFYSSGTVRGNIINALSSLCINGSCISSWGSAGDVGLQRRVSGTCAAGSSIRVVNADGTVSCETDDVGAGGGTGTVTSVATNNGLTGGTITTTGTLGLNLTGISTCTNSTSNKIYWNGSYLACGTDQTGGAGGLSGSGSTNYVSKWSGATSLGNSLIYDNGTNVGIGTASPSEKLHINGSVYVGSNWYKAGNITSVNNALSVWGAEGGVLSGFASGRAVAIGQTTSGFAGLGISSGVSPRASFYYDHFGNSAVVQSYGSGNVGLTTDFGTGNIFFATNGNVNRMTITSGGNVGIGRSPAWARLEVGGQMQVYPAGTSRFFIEDGGGERITAGAYKDGLGFKPLLIDGNAIELQTRSGSNVGIGTASPTQKLEVGGVGKFGRFYIRDTQYGTGSGPGIGTDGSGVGVQANYFNVGSMNGTAYSPVYASDYWINNAGRWAGSFSDLRLKKDIQPLMNTLDKVLNVRGISFNWNDAYAALGHPNDKRQIGVIAQELETQFPELVTASSTDGYKTINYEGLTAVLVEAIKEQQKEIKEQQKEIEALKARIDALEKK